MDPGDLPALRALSEDDVYQLCGPNVYERADRYYRNDLVMRPRLEDGALVGEVQGSRRKPYRVEVTLEADQISAACECPHWAEYCKHVGALLLTWIRDPGSFAHPVVSRARSGPARAAEGEAAPPAALPLEPLPGEATSSESFPEEELRHLLELRTVPELRQIAKRRGLTLRGATKGDLVAQLAAGLLEPEGLRAAVAVLGAPELVTLDVVYLLAGDQFVTLGAVEDALTTLDIRLLQDARALLADLCERGLVAGAERNGHAEEAYRVPSGVAACLPVPDYLVRRAEGEAPPEPPPRGLPVDELLYLIWRHFKQNAVQPRPQPPRTLLEQTADVLRGWHNVPDEVAELRRRANWQWLEGLSLTALPPPPELADDDLAALARMTGGDREAAEFAFHLLRELRLISGKDRFTAQEEPLRRFLSQAPSLRRHTIALTWLALVGWSELTLVLRHDRRLCLRRRLSAQASFRPKDLFDRLARGRALLVRLLGRLEEGVWYSLPALLETMRQFGRGTLYDDAPRSGRSEPGWWLALETGRRLDPRDPWDWAEGYGRFVVEALRGPLHWLGVVTMAGEGPAAAFRVEGLRALLRGVSEDAGPLSPIQVAANMTVTVPPGAGGLPVHEFLLAVAEMGEATPDGLQYRLTPARARAAFGAGHDAAEIVAFLERASDGQVPPAVRAKLEDWWERHGTVHLYGDLSLIEFADDYTLPELLATTGLSRHLIYQFSPRLIAVDAEAVDGLVEEMVRKGHTPKVAEGMP